MLRTVPLSIIRSLSLYTQQYIQVMLTACEQEQEDPFWSCSQAVSKPLWHIPLLCVQRKTPDDGQSNCSKHVEFYSKNKFEKLVHLVGFIIRMYHDARSAERQSEIKSLFVVYTCYLYIRCIRLVTLCTYASTSVSPLVPLTYSCTAL